MTSCASDETYKEWSARQTAAELNAAYDNRQRSFVCRHLGVCMSCGLMLAVTPLLVMAMATGSVAQLVELACTSFTGLLLTGFCLARPGHRCWATALIEELVVLACVSMLGIFPLMYAAFCLGNKFLG